MLTRSSRPWSVLVLAVALAAPAAGCSKSNDSAPSPAPAPAAAKGENVLRGTIEVKPELAGNVAAQDTIFISARKGQAPGPPLAVKKLAVGTFPLAFELTKDDVMVKGTDPSAQFTGDVEITVRVDKDGDAMSKNPGDLVGKSGSVQVGNTAIRIVIDQALP